LERVSNGTGLLNTWIIELEVRTPALYYTQKTPLHFLVFIHACHLNNQTNKKTDLSIRKLKHQLTSVQSKLLSTIEKPKDSFKFFFDFISGIDCGERIKTMFISYPTFLIPCRYLIWNLSWLATWKHQVKELQTSHHLHRLQLTSNNLLNTWEHL
jgi:hypothetical protein